MANTIQRRHFIKTTATGGLGLSLAGNLFSLNGTGEIPGAKIGIIGLDTSHSTAFTKELNDPAANPVFGGYKVVAAYPRGSNDIKSSTDRIPAYTEEVRKLGVEIVSSIEELLTKVDVVLLETNDGRLHLEQAKAVMKAGKRIFIDKPIAASLADTIAIFNEAESNHVPVFSSSSLRYITGIQDIAKGSEGRVLGADVYSPATLEKTHPDLFWYGVHGVEMLFTAMGTGCKKVVRTYTDNTDVVTGTWKDNRIGTFRGIRNGKAGYGGTIFTENGISVLGKYNGYSELLVEIIKFFQTGVVPVMPDETIEIFTFMQAAEVSKQRGGIPVDMQEILKKATDDSKN